MVAVSLKKKNAKLNQETTTRSEEPRQKTRTKRNHSRLWTQTTYTPPIMELADDDMNSLDHDRRPMQQIGEHNI